MKRSKKVKKHDSSSPVKACSASSMDAAKREQRINCILAPMHKGQYAAMENTARLFAAEYPTDGKILHLQAFSLVMQQKNVEAEGLLRRAVLLEAMDAEIWDLLAVVLMRLNKNLEAESYFAQSIALQERRADTWINSARNANELGYYDKGESRSRNALRLDPQNSKALNNLGCAFNGQKRFAEARQCLLESLRLSPGNSRTITTLACTISEKAFLERDDNGLREAQTMYDQVLQVDPELEETLSGLASVNFRLGELSGAIENYAKQLVVRKRIRDPRIIPTPRPAMPREPAREALCALHSVLANFNTPFFLTFGTLLGVCREGDILPHDKDLDVGLFWDVPRKPLHDYLASHGFEITPLAPGEDDNANLNTGLTHTKTSIAIDLFYFKKDGDSLLTGIMQRPVPILFRFPNFSLTSTEWIGRKWNIPKPPEAFLESMYGKQWRVPDPYFDGLLSGCNRLTGSNQVSLCFGHSRLLENLTNYNYPKALAYCRQILALQDDPIVREWAEWLITTDQCRAIAAQGSAL